MILAVWEGEGGLACLCGAGSLTAQGQRGRVGRQNSLQAAAEMPVKGSWSQGTLAQVAHPVLADTVVMVIIGV